MTFKHVQICEGVDVYLGDNMAVLRDVKPKIDTVLTDPPYKMDTSGGGEFRKSRGYMDEIAANGTADGFDIEVYHYAMALGANCLVTFYSWQQEAQISRFFNTGYFGRNKPLFNPAKILFEYDMPMQWHKTNPTRFCNRAFVADVEYIRMGWRAPFKLKLRPSADMLTWWENGNGRNEFGHPSVKPIGLMQKLVKNASHRGQLVLDMFAGTGSTGVGCIELGRRFIGIERDEKYFWIMVERLRAAVAAFEAEKWGDENDEYGEVG